MLKKFPAKAKTLDELKELQLKGLKWTVNHAYNGSEFYRKKFEEAGVTPDDIKSLDDITKLPFTTAQDLRDGYPFPLRSVPYKDIVRIHASSGTTGKRKVLCYTKKDIEDWIYMFSRCYEMAGLTKEDRVQICVGYGVWTAGFGFQIGCENFGAMALPTGPGNVDMQCTFLVDFQTTVMCCTASMALLMAEEINKRGIRNKINLKKIILGSERTSEAIIEKIKALTGVEEIFDIPGLTELYGPGTGLDCKYHNGIHYWADFYILEIINPETLEPVAPGEVGEMVYTTLCKEAAPLIRYRSRDLTKLILGDCECGCIFPRHDKIIGRSDDMFIFRGVNIYPAEIDSILSEIKNIGSEYQIILERKDDGKDYMLIKVERNENVDKSIDGKLRKIIQNEIKKRVMVTSFVEIVDYKSLPRSERKTKRVFDNRFEEN
jgi:phenylacetate-CoA ligase